MKKNKSIFLLVIIIAIIILLIVISLFLPLSTKEKNLTCNIDEINDYGTTSRVVTSIYEKNKISTVQVDINLTLNNIYRENKIYKEIISNVKDSIDSQYIEYKSMTGVTYLSSMDLEYATIKISIYADLNQANDDTKAKLNISNILEDEEYDDTKITFENKGYTCK